MKSEQWHKKVLLKTTARLEGSGWAALYFSRKIYIATTHFFIMSLEDNIYGLLNDFSIEHFQNLPEATVRAEDFDALMRKIGNMLSCEKG